MDKNTCKVLEYIGRSNNTISYDQVISKFRGLMVPTIEDCIFSLKADNMIDIGYSNIDENNNPINPATIIITAKGKEFIEKSKSEKHDKRFSKITIIITILLTVVSIIIGKILDKLSQSSK